MAVDEELFKHIASFKYAKRNSNADLADRQDRRISELNKSEVERVENISERSVMRRKLYRMARYRISRTAWERLDPKPKPFDQQEKSHLSTCTVKQSSKEWSEDPIGAFYGLYEDEYDEQTLIDYFKLLEPSPPCPVEVEGLKKHKLWKKLAILFKNPLVANLMKRRLEMVDEVQGPNKRWKKLAMFFKNPLVANAIKRKREMVDDSMGAFFGLFDDDYDEPSAMDHFKILEQRSSPSPVEVAEFQEVEHRKQNEWKTLSRLFKNPLVANAIRRRRVQSQEMREDKNPEEKNPQTSDTEHLLLSQSEILVTHLPKLEKWRDMHPGQKEKLFLARLSAPCIRSVRAEDVYTPRLTKQQRPKNRPIRITFPENYTSSDESDEDRTMIEVTITPRVKHRTGRICRRRIYQERQHEFYPDRKFFNNYLKTETMQTWAAENTRRLAKEGEDFLLGRKKTKQDEF